MSKINNFVIRDFDKSDYPAIATIFNSVFPDKATTAEEYIEQDQNRHKKCKQRRWVAVDDDMVIGTGTYSQNVYQYHPNKFKIWVVIKPEYQNKGIGSKLYDQIIKAMEQFDPISMITEARDDMPGTIRFLQSRGLKEFQQYSEPHLEVAKFDFAPYENLEAKLNSEGVIIKTMRELEDDPQRDKKLFELDNKVAADLPDEETFTPIDYASFEKDVLYASYSLHDAYFIAIDNGKYIGLSNLHKFKAEKNLETGLTGVLRPYRKRGIATCLKVKAVEYAKNNNYDSIGTENQSGNKPMLDLNNKLGFKEKYVWLCYKKVLRNNTE
ncbi:MAG: GNAT family N-acetyltransferase [candidate division Zixibacteria bacterium]|nr:GNAT family N-acetyltransferase [candidate division Zixibacteria bacterium]